MSVYLNYEGFELLSRCKNFSDTINTYKDTDYELS